MDTKPEESITYDKYEDSFFIEKYVALWAYGYVNNIKFSERLYKKIIKLGQNSFKKDSNLKMLDIGCGVGRTVVDYAQSFSNARVIGIDKAEKMINYARKIALSSDCLYLDMRKIGFSRFELVGFGLSNVDFENISLKDFYDKSPKSNFDLITSVNFIDRIDNVEESFRMVFDLLKDGGIYIFSSPLNFMTPEKWEKYGSVKLIRKVVAKVGFKVSFILDNVTYRELLDARGAYEQYPTLVMKLIK